MKFITLLYLLHADYFNLRYTNANYEIKFEFKSPSEQNNAFRP